MGEVDTVQAPSLLVQLEPKPPPRGSVRCGDLPPVPFEGWVALAAAVDACVTEATRPA